MFSFSLLDVESLKSSDGFQESAFGGAGGILFLSLDVIVYSRATLTTPRSPACDPPVQANFMPRISLYSCGQGGRSPGCKWRASSAISASAVGRRYTLARWTAQRPLLMRSSISKIWTSQTTMPLLL